MNLPELRENKFLICEDFLDATQAEKLVPEFRNLCLSKNIPGDPQVPRSSSVYGYHPFQQLLYDRVHYVNQKLGLYVFPTYTYARLYLKGSDLPVHLDRDACEISVTLNLSGDKEWPIYFRHPSGEDVPITLIPGQAALYLGREVQHWREPYVGEEYFQVFFHYVNSEGPFAHCIHDSR